jgi:peroxiredoxin
MKYSHDRTENHPLPAPGRLPVVLAAAVLALIGLHGQSAAGAYPDPAAAASTADAPAAGISPAGAPAMSASAAGAAAMEAPASGAPSTAEVGQKAPGFTLKDTEGKEYNLADYTAHGQVVVLEWFNPDCPFVRRHHEKLKDMEKLSSSYRKDDVVWLAVNSGAPGNQGAGLERNIQAKKDYQLDYPILLDEAGLVGRAYGAKTTPTMAVIAKDGTLVYLGAIDDDPRGEKSPRTNYVETALDQLLAGKPVTLARTASYGCSVKYGTKA